MARVLALEVTVPVAGTAIVVGVVVAFVALGYFAGARSRARRARGVTRRRRGARRARATAAARDDQREHHGRQAREPAQVHASRRRHRRSPFRLTIAHVALPGGMRLQSQDPYRPESFPCRGLRPTVPPTAQTRRWTIGPTPRRASIDLLTPRRWLPSRLPTRGGQQRLARSPQP